MECFSIRLCLSLQFHARDVWVNENGNGRQYNNPNLVHSTRTGAARTPTAHYIIPRGVVYAKCKVVQWPLSNGGVRREKDESMDCSRRILLFRLKITLVASSVAALGRLKKEEIFDQC